MAKKSKKKIKAVESERMRQERVSGTNNGLTLRTRTVPSKKKYSRKNIKIELD